MPPGTDGTNYVTSLGFTPNGQWLLAANSGGDALLWRLRLGAKPVALGGNHGFVFHARLNASGTRALTATHLGAQVWQVPSGKRLAQWFRGLPVPDAVFSPDGTLVAGGHDVFHVQPWRHVSDIGAIGDRAAALAFSADGTLVAEAEDSSNVVRIWRVAPGVQIATLRGSGGYVDGITFAPAGRLVLTRAGDGIARLWDAPTGVELAALRDSRSAEDASFSHDGRLILVAGQTASVYRCVPCGSFDELLAAADTRIARTFSGPERRRALLAVASSR
jgi:WD40 repeat protein